MDKANLRQASAPGLRPVRWLALLQKVIRQSERGSAEGGTFADIAYMPFLTALLLLGLVLAAVGFWRVGASYSSQRGAQIGAVAPDQGGAATSGFWQGWTGKNVSAS